MNTTLALTKEETQILADNITEMNKGKFDHKAYTKRVRELFKLKSVPITERRLCFLAGFIEGEGSLSIGAKKNNAHEFGLELDPVFNLTQRVEGISNLYLALEVFQTGRIRLAPPPEGGESGSNATLVFVIEPRKSLEEKVCPFFDKYIIKYNLSSNSKQSRYLKFKEMLGLFNTNAHLDRDRFIKELLPIWDSMRIQKSTKQTFKDLEEAQEFVRNFQKE
jgi:hypothetical protein